jgi:GNAT superfamily N-acetyltransferase
LTPLEFRDGRVDAGDGDTLVQAMREEIAVIYPGVDLTGDYMPRGGPAELSPPDGGFIVGYLADEPICCGGVKRLAESVCEIKRMYVVPARRGTGVARVLLYALEARACELGYTVARLDTGPRQERARGLYESEGYLEIGNFNNNPVASFWGEKRLAPGKP